MISFWLRSAFAWADAAFAATLENGDAALAAIGLTMPFEFMLIACWVGSSNGLTARLSAAMGAREGERIEQLKRATRRLIRVLILVFLLLSAGIWLFAERVGLEPEIGEAFRVYGTVLMAGSAFTSFWSILPDSLVKAHHDTRSTMWAGLLSSVVNVALNAVFVFVFHWGIFGIALSTVIGRLAGYFYAVGRAEYHERLRRGSGRDDRPGLFERPVRAILGIAVPAGISFLLMSLELLAINAILARSENSTAALAAFSIFDRSVRFMAMPVIACGVAMLPLTGKLWGAGDTAGIRLELRTVYLATAGYLVAVLIPLALLLGPWVAEALSDSEATRQGALTGMLWVPLAVVAMAPMLVQRSAFEGMQRPRPGLVVSLLRSFALVIPLALLGLLLAPRLGYSSLAGVYAGSTLGNLLASVLMSSFITRALREPAGAEPAPRGAQRTSV